MSVSSTTVAPAPTTGASGVTAADLCSGAVHAAAGTVTSDLLGEISGLAASRADADVLYAHNDSGDSAAIYGIDHGGALLDIWLLDAVAIDWEDMAATASHLYLADIGDNLRLRPAVRIVRVPEAALVDGAIAADVIESATFRYADGPRDAEAVIVDPLDDEVTIITKGGDDASGIHRGPFDPASDAVELERAGVVGVEGEVTGADVSADGRVIAVRTYDAVHLFDRPDGASVAAALAGPSCAAPVVDERQGEAIALHPDGRGYTTISEGLHPTRNDFRLPSR